MHGNKLDNPVTVTARTAIAIFQRAQAFDMLLKFMESEGYQIGHFEADLSGLKPGATVIVKELEAGAETPPEPKQEMADAIHKATGFIVAAAVGDPATTSGATYYNETKSTRRPDRNVS